MYVKNDIIRYFEKTNSNIQYEITTRIINMGIIQLTPHHRREGHFFEYIKIIGECILLLQRKGDVCVNKAEMKCTQITVYQFNLPYLHKYIIVIQIDFRFFIVLNLSWRDGQDLR